MVNLESEALLVKFVIENYFIAITALISNSGCINCGVLIAAFQFSSHSVLFRCALLNQHNKRV